MKKKNFSSSSAYGRALKTQKELELYKAALIQELEEVDMSIERNNELITELENRK